MSVSHLPPLRIASLHRAYAQGEWTPVQLVEALDAAIRASEPTAIWIERFSREALLERARFLQDQDPAGLPLYGVPFAIKDNIDIAGLPTTAACPGFAYRPTQSAAVVARLLAAGAIPVGKTNLDQFATGLVGVRSPYGVPANAIDPDYIPGGSSSGSAVAVARGFASFALGTDTAGSGRIPAAFNRLVGHKPTRGLLSCGGVVPACRSLDCVSIFATNAHDATLVHRAAMGFDAGDPYSREAPASLSLAPERFRFGVPAEEHLEFFGNQAAAERFREAVTRMEEMGGTRIEIDFGPFREAARLLYEGPWLAERYVVLEEILRERPEILHPVTRGIIEGGGRPSAADAFRAAYRLKELERLAGAQWADVDVMLTPTAGTIYTLAEVAAEPVRLNTNLGYYTNYVNLLDLAATAIPAGDLPGGLPFGVTLVAPAFSDERLLDLAARFLREDVEATKGVPDGWVLVAVCGAHMEGLPFNRQLLDRGGRFLERTVTAPNYRFYVLPRQEGLPDRPGLVRQTRDGAGGAIELEVWLLPEASFGGLVARIPAPLGIGKVELADGRQVPGFLCEFAALDGAEDITTLGGWRAYLASR